MKEIIGLLTFVVLSIPSSVLPQEQPLKVKGGHELGETAEQFFAEGRERDVLSACAQGDFKSVNKSSRRQLKQFCSEFAGERLQAMSGNRSEYKTGGDPSEMRADTFTFDGGRLVKVELVFSAPSAEFNYRGQRFEEILAGVKQTYGSPTSENTAPVKDAYGVEYVAHRETWVTPHTAILIAEQPGPGGSTTVLAFTRSEYDNMIAAGTPKAPNPLR